MNSDFLRERLIPFASDALRDAFAAYRAGGDLQTETKADGSPASRADRDTERGLREIIAAAYPDHGIAGEEFGISDPDAEYVWVLDPLDGTREFLAQESGWGSLIALLRRGKPVMGAIAEPLAGAFWDQDSGFPTPAAAKTLSAATISSTSSAHMFAATPFEAGAKKLFGQCRKVVERLNCIGFARAATGDVDLAIENKLKLHDIAALLPVLWASGALCVDLQGKDYQDFVFDVANSPSAKYGIVTGRNANLVREAVKVLNGV